MDYTQNNRSADSVWSNTLEIPAFPPLTHDLSTEVLVVGGGLAGILCAYRLKKEGIPVVVLEADRVGNGITKDTTAKITSQHGMIYCKMLKRFGTEITRRYIEANEDALLEYQLLAGQITCDFKEQDNYIYTRNRPEKVEAELKALQRIGYPARYEEKLPLPFHTVGAVVFPNQAEFHPLKFLSGIVQGLEIYEHTEIMEFLSERIQTGQGSAYRVKWKSRANIFKRAGNDIEVNHCQTREGIIRAKKVIMATHFPINNKHGAYFMKMYQNHSYVVGLEGVPTFPGMYLDEAEEGYSFRFYGNMLLLGGGSHRTGKKAKKRINLKMLQSGQAQQIRQPEKMQHPGQTQQEQQPGQKQEREIGPWQDLRIRAGQWYPGSYEVYHWAAQDCMTLDQIPYIGQYSGRTPGFYVSTGFNKWGMTSSMVAAKLLCDMIQGKENPYAEVFNPSRTIFRKQLFINMGESAVNLVTPTKKRCPHLGCALKWNQEEHSWDCPCHGSRFSKDGKLLDNPATGDLTGKALTKGGRHER